MDKGTQLRKYGMQYTVVPTLRRWSRSTGQGQSLLHHELQLSLGDRRPYLKQIRKERILELATEQRAREDQSYQSGPWIGHGGSLRPGVLVGHGGSLRPGVWVGQGQVSAL